MYDASHPVLFNIRTQEVQRRYAGHGHDHSTPAVGGWRAERRRAERNPGKAGSRRR